MRTTFMVSSKNRKSRLRTATPMRIWAISVAAVLLPPTRATLNRPTGPQPAPINNQVIERPDEQDCVDDQEPSRDLAGSHLDVASGIVLDPLCLPLTRVGA